MSVSNETIGIIGQLEQALPVRRASGGCDEGGSSGPCVVGPHKMGPVDPMPVDCRTREFRSSARLPIRKIDLAYADIGELAYDRFGGIAPPKRGRASRLGFSVDLASVTPKMQVRAPCRQRIGAGEKGLDLHESLDGPMETVRRELWRSGDGVIRAGSW